MTHASLIDLRKQLDHAFRRARRGRVMHGSPLTVTEEMQASMRLPIDEIAVRDLSRYAFKATTTWGTPDDYRYHLPRILELMLSPEGRGWPGFSSRVVASKLLLTEWRSWPTEEQDTVEGALRTYWRGMLGGYLSEMVAWFVEDTLRRLDLPVKEWLADWDLAASPDAVRVFYDLVIDGRRIDPGLDAFRRDPARREELEAAFSELMDTPEADAIAHTLDRWELEFG